MKEYLFSPRVMEKVLILVSAALGSGFGMWANNASIATKKDRIIFFFLGIAASCFATPVVQDVWKTSSSWTAAISFAVSLTGASLVLEVIKSVPKVYNSILDKYLGRRRRDANDSDNN